MKRSWASIQEKHILIPLPMSTGFYKLHVSFRLKLFKVFLTETDGQIALLMELEYIITKTEILLKVS